MTYEFRELTSRDFFLLIKLAKKLDLEAIKNIFKAENMKEIINGIVLQEETTDETAEEMTEETTEEKDNGKYLAVGASIFIEVAQVVISNLDNCEKEIYDILANCSNLKKEQIYKMPMSDFICMVIEFFRKEDFQQAFTKVVSLFK